MPAQLFLVPSIEVAYKHAKAHVAAVRRANPLTPAYLLLPSAGAIQNARWHLGSPLGATMGVQLWQFYTLSQTILNEAGSPIQRIEDLAVRRLVRQIANQMGEREEWTTFAAIASKPGFCQLMVDWLREMKSQGIEPQQVQEYAGISGRERDRQLAQFYQYYQDYLQQHGFSDGDGLLWLTSEALEADPQLVQHIQPLCLMGFDHFNPIQRRILHQMAQRISDLVIYLLWDDKRPQNSLALTRLSQTRLELRRLLEPEEQILEDTGSARPALVHLRQTLFESKPDAVNDDDQRTIQAVAAPSREAEVRLALREIKQLLLDGITPDKIALLAPQPGTYRRLVETVAAEYGVPVRFKKSLGHSPAAAALLNLLSLAPEFPWRQTFDALRSPYIQQPWLSQEQIERLDRLTRERPVLSGREQWLFALQPLQIAEAETEYEDRSGLPLVAQLPPAELVALEDGLTIFFDHLTREGKATHDDHAWWVQTAILGLFPEEKVDGDPSEQPSLEMIKCCQNGPQSQQDMLAMAQVVQLLRDLVKAAALIKDKAGQVPWETFRNEFLDGLGAKSLPPKTTQPAVRFAVLGDGRAVVIDYLFVLGLSEGEFPKPPAPDPIYAPAERRAQTLPLSLVRPGEDASLWWQIIANCRLRLTLLRPRIDEGGAPWLPSPYWDAVLDKVEGLVASEPPVAGLPVVDEAASPAELLAALAGGGVQNVPENLHDPWRAAEFARDVIGRRSGWLPQGDHEGVLNAPDILEELVRGYGVNHSWSTSRLNRYGICPFGFFAQEVLKIGSITDPEEGFDPLQRGSLLHAVLERLYRRLADEKIAPTETNREQVLAYLENTCAALFPGAPQRYGFRPGPLWRYEQQELRRLLRALLSWECEENGAQARFLPYRQELRFGLRGGLERLRLQDELGTEFHLRGVIDRLDLDEAGNAQVIDYKSGSSGYSIKDIRQGLAFQTALYALAAESLLPEVNRVADSAYLHIPTRKFSGQLQPESQASEDETIKAALDQASLFVQRVRHGIFPSAPGKPAAGATACHRFCELASLCRVTRHSIQKSRQEFGT